MRERAPTLTLTPTMIRSALAAALAAVVLLAIAGSAHASTGDPPVRGADQAPLRAGGTLGQLNPQPEPPGISAEQPPPADGQCATCEPPGGDPGPHQTNWKPYEIEIRKIRLCDTEDANTDEIYININGTKVWGIWGLTNQYAPGCTQFNFGHREAVKSFTGWATVDMFDEDWPDPDDWLVTKTIYMMTQPPITTNPPKWTGTIHAHNSSFSYEIDYEIRPKP